MTNKFDSFDALMSGYVAGKLPLPLSVLVASHLALSDRNRGLVAGLETAAGDALTELAPMPMKDRNSALDVIFASAKPRDIAVKGPSCSVMPQPLVDFVGHRVADIPWKTKMPGFKEYDLPDMDGCHVSMFWIKPGRTVPMHTHEGFELSLVLTGAFNDDRGRFGRGDISIADDSVEHRPTAEMSEPCIGFAVTDGSLRLTGPLHQRLGDILGAY